MKTTITLHDFRVAFHVAGRGDQFSHSGLEVLFDYLTDYEDQTGEELELDVVALCCDFYEAHWQEIADDYRIDLTSCDDEDDKIEAVCNYLNENTVVVGESPYGVFVYGAF
jgi:predicted ArsR family transcriptional regulator